MGPPGNHSSFSVRQPGGGVQDAVKIEGDARIWGSWRGWGPLGARAAWLGGARAIGAAACGGTLCFRGGRFEGDLSGCVQASEPEHSRSVRQPEAVIGETGLRAGERVAAKFCTPQDSSKTFVVRVPDGAGS